MHKKNPRNQLGKKKKKNPGKIRRVYLAFFEGYEIVEYEAWVIAVGHCFYLAAITAVYEEKKPSLSTCCKYSK